MSTEMTSEQLQQIYISNIHGRTKRQQPLHTCQAHVFHIDPSTKKSWVPASTSAIPVSFFYDGTRGLYRIISVEGNTPVINCTVTANMNFTKTSQKFGQWADSKVNTVYGLGFPTESEIDKFVTQFQEVKDSLRLNNSSPNKTINGIGQPCKPNGIVGTTPNNGTTTTTTTTNIKITDADANNIGPPAPTTDVNANSVYTLRRPPNLAGDGSPYKIRMESPKRIQYLEKLEMDGRLTPETQLKYENDRLRQALQQSSANAKMWELELANLKANNARLTNALQDCTFGVEEWKHQLDMYREENQRLRQQILESEASSGNMNAVGELQKQLDQMRDKVEYCTKLLKQKDEEILMTKEKLSKQSDHNQETDLIWKTLQKTQTQLQMTVETHKCQKKVLDALNGQLGEKLNDLSGIKGKITDALHADYSCTSSPK